MGVVGIIAPWNFPFQLSMVPVVSALIAGNTVVLKPSEVTPITGEIIDEIFRRIGMPRGVVEVIQGDGSTGAALTRAPIDKVFFTGSVATGRKVMAAAAEHPIPVELELGGKDAMIVLEDANLERAAKAAMWGGLVNCGQMCTSVERILVVDEVHDRFVAPPRGADASKVRVGGPEEHPDMGPITFPKQLETIERHVEAGACEAGAKLLFGGERLDRPGQFYAPTLHDRRQAGDGDLRPGDLRPGAAGDPRARRRGGRPPGQRSPVRPDRQRLDGKDVDRGIEIASRMECGQVNVNDLVVSVGNPVPPLRRRQGQRLRPLPRPGGAALSFTHQKAIFVDRGKLMNEPFWFPYRRKFGAMRGAFHGLLSGNLPKALYSLFQLKKINDDADRGIT